MASGISIYIILVGFATSVICHSNTPPFPQVQAQAHQHQQEQFQQAKDQKQAHNPVDVAFNEGLPHGQPGRMGAAQFHDKNHIMDKDHLNEHLDGVVKQNEQMSDEEMQFHYFKVHDYDNNNMLDGIELMSALTHFHKEEAVEHEPDRMPDEEIAELIDEIMKEDDLNGDGYIDYAEFISSQQR